MAELAVVIGASHAPGQTGIPELAPPDKRQATEGAWAELRRRIDAADPDLLVMISNDHLQNFYPVQPAFCVGVAESHTLPHPSYRRMLHLEPRAVAGRPAFAEALLDLAARAGFPLAYAEEFKFGDEFAVPLHFLDPEGRRAILPVMTNCLGRHLPAPDLFFRLGALVRDWAVRAEAPRRVAVIATGGLSHDPLGPGWSLVDEAFDRRFLALLGAGDTDGLLREYTLERMVEPGKGGTPETLNWFAAMGAAGAGAPAEVLCYQPVHEWATGTGLAVWDGARLRH